MFVNIYFIVVKKKDSENEYYIEERVTAFGTILVISGSLCSIPFVFIASGIIGLISQFKDISSS